ncbi:hypothetical protein C4J81_01760 [Deltaproteobacteria bacterium Smac51]|nr:hypothetical protein C4J81_01760 [Deltaproteobacteria bacterium Smac51]
MSWSKNQKASEQFRELLGKANLSFPDELSGFDRFDVQTAIVEQYGQSLNLHKGPQMFQILLRGGLNALLNCDQQSMIPRFQPVPSLYEGARQMPYTTIGWYCYLKKCSPRQAVAELATLLHLTEDRLFGTPDSKIFKQARDEKTRCAYVPKYLNILPSFITISSSKYDLFDDIIFTSAKQHIIGGIIRYKNSDEKEVYVPFHLDELGQNTQIRHSCPIVVPGLGSGLLPLLNENLFSKDFSQNKTVFIFEDIRIALKLQYHLSQWQSFKSSGHYITSWYGGGNLAAHVDFNSLYGTHAIFIPALKRDSYRKMPDILAKTEMFRSLKILRQQILIHKIIHPAQGAKLENRWEDYIVNNSDYIQDWPYDILQAMSKNALPLETYKAWGAEVGLFNEHATTVITSDAPQVQSLTELLEKAPSSLHREEASLKCFCQPHNMTLIYSTTNSGKTLAALGLSMALITGQSFFRIAKTNPSSTLYVDAETEPSTFDEKLLRVMAACGYSSDNIKGDLFNKITLRSQQTSLTVDLNDDLFRKFIESKIEQTKSKVLIFDNLISLLPGFRQSGGSMWKQLRPWLIDLENKKNIAIILVHHSNADNEAAGTLDLEAQCQNVIKIEGRDILEAEIQKKPNGETASQFGAFIPKEGALFRVTFKKCKMFSELEVQKPFGAFLELTERSRTHGPSWQWIEALPNLASTARNLIEDVYSKYPDLSSYERKVMSYAQQKDSFTRLDMESYLKLEKSKTASILKILVERGLLKKEGESRATKYRLADQVARNE